VGISSVTASTAVYVQRFCNAFRRPLGLERSSWRLEGVSRVSGFGVVLIMDVEASLLPGQCVDSELRLLALWCVEASASRSQVLFGHSSVHSGPRAVFALLSSGVGVCAHLGLDSQVFVFAVVSQVGSSDFNGT
jgi:hypothetical protein